MCVSIVLIFEVIDLKIHEGIGFSTGETKS